MRSIGIIDIQRFTIGEVFWRPTGPQVCMNMKYRIHQYSYQKSYYGRKWNKVSVQAAIIVIVDLSQHFVRGDNSQYMLNLLSLFMYAITK